MTLQPVALLVLARSIGFAFRAPGFSHPSVPPPLRAAFALLLALALAPSVRASTVPLDAVAFVVALATEFLLGSAIGMAASLVYDGAYAGGRAIDDYVGVKALAPSAQLVAPSGFGRLWSLAFTGGFFVTGAYRPTIEAFALGFARIPPGSPFDAHAWAPFVAGCLSTIVLVGVRVAAPSIALAFAMQIGLGALARAVPRFASLTLSFPLAFGAAFLATAVALPLLAYRAVVPVLAFPHAAVP